MLTWVQQFWPLCLIAVLIGFATGWWAWAGVSAPRARGRRDRRPFPLPALDQEQADPSAPEVLVEEAIVETVVETPETVVPVFDPPAAPARPNISPAVGDPDDLEKIKGVGPALGALLTSLGVSRFDQIAQWGEAEVAEVDQHLGSFRGRIDRDHWVDQARLLAAGDTETFEARYGQLGSEQT